MTIPKISKIKGNIRTLLGATEFKSVKTLMHQLSISTVKKAHQFLLDNYNDIVEDINENERRKKEKYQMTNRLQRKENKAEAKAFLANISSAVTETHNRKRDKPVMPILDFKLDKNGNKVYKFEKYVKYWNQMNNKNNNKFSILLKSKMSNAQHTFKFNDYLHFHNWFEKVIQNNISSEEYGSVVKYSKKFKPVNFKSNIINPNFKAIEDGVFDGLVEINNIKVLTGGCNKHKACDKDMLSSFYKFKLHNPSSMNNNCFFACLNYLGYNVDTKQMRKQFNLKGGTEISVNDAYKIIRSLNSNIEIIDPTINEELDDNKQYLLLKNNHYYVVKDFEENKRKDKKTKRGLLAFDFETRPTEEYHLIKASNTKSYILKDTICCGYYKSFQSQSFNELTFITNNEKSSARQFIDWLNNEAVYNRSYNVIAHNGGKFDFYFFISNLTEKELLESEIQMRGTTIIGINYRGNLFKDTYCFLTDSLSKLSKSFKAEHGKICSMELHGKSITSAQLCFYKPDLTFQEFLNLKNTDTEFWNLYTKYCIYDCIALYEIWRKFTECVNTLIKKINPSLLRKCPLMAASTIGSHSKKIIVECNKFDGQINSYKKGIEEFTGISYYKNGKDYITDIDYDKYNFLCNFKRGGISHCNKPGKHMSGITGVDIASQYSASLMYTYIPSGKSEWIHYYDDKKYGFYLLRNVKFNSYLLKPVADSTGSSLNWAKNSIDELYIDSYMIDYLKQNYGLVSFDVDKGLVSNRHIEGRKLFGKYIETFYNEKKLQDKYNDIKNENYKLYNEALRSTIKLYLNSLTGKLVENPAIHFTMQFADVGCNSLVPLDVKNQYLDSTKKLNGANVLKMYNSSKINDWIVAGIMVYSYSKRLLFEYIKCLPNNSNDVIHIETDGIYFSTRCLDSFTENLNNYEGDYPCKFGEDMGNLKIEKSTHQGQVAYFLGKKFYNITLNDNYLEKERDDDDKSIYRIKGIPQKTLDKEGNTIFLVDTKLYENIYNGNEVSRSFSTLKKSLFTDATNISTHMLTRRIRPNCKYDLYM